MTTSHLSEASSSLDVDRRVPRWQRFFGVVVETQTYRNIAYLFVGLPLGVTWSTALVTGAAVGASMLAVALVGIPILVGMWHVTHWFACADRHIANHLLGADLRDVPIEPASGSLWQRLRTMTADRHRRHELGVLLARLPIGIATFALAATLVVAPTAIAYAPIHARISDEPFGTWSMSASIQDIASSGPLAWALTPVGALGLVASLHGINRIAELTVRLAEFRS